MGNSFGNRVICELLDKLNKTIPNNLAGVILCGYPLYGDGASEKAKEERVKQLSKFPKQVKLLLISGSKDEFLHRSYLAKGTGKQLLIDTFESLNLLNNESKVLVIDGGKHDLAHGKNNAEKLLEQIKLFCK